MIKRLKHILNCDNYKELARTLGVKVSTVRYWRRKKTPDNIRGLLTFIEHQYKEIRRLNKLEKKYKMVENKRTGFPE